MFAAKRSWSVSEYRPEGRVELRQLQLRRSLQDRHTSGRKPTLG